MRVPKSAVHLEVGIMGCPVLVEDGCVGVSDVTALHRCFRKAEITDEVMAEGGRHCVQEPGDYKGEYLDENEAKKVDEDE